MKKKKTQPPYDLSTQKGRNAYAEAISKTPDQRNMFTGGEWKIDSANAGIDIPIWNEKECICTVWSSPEVEANAALIAEAPAMYREKNRLLSALYNIREAVSQNAKKSDILFLIDKTIKP